MSVLEHAGELGNIFGTHLEEITFELSSNQRVIKRLVMGLER